MLEKLYPNESIASSYDIDYQKLYDKGYRGIIFDIDNTLVPHGAPATKEAIALFEKIRGCGLKTCLISNNKKPRVKSFADAVKSKYLYDAHKPSREGYIKCLFELDINLKQAIFVGDQLFTDIAGAKRTGIYSILVKPIHPKEEIQIRLKRILERPILYFYNKNKNK